ncbi:MAG: diphthine--ammonia ligase [Thermoplasmata archaeon]|nr:diphthine--ammonia ligase [Thermoplasmata archaeon]MCI4359898.1 diphthine--ammonia ligase [Thermoplasmata archaeon]
MSTALVSGGKDSIYSAYLADTQGWSVDELLVLVPEDVDSFLLHTPNLALVELQGTAWGKRVRTVPIHGQGEALEANAIAMALAEGNGAVIAGAIASSYQWARLNRITTKLGRPLYAPLWGKDPSLVVREEIAGGLDIRLVQVAAEPLGAELLGRRLDLALLSEIERLGRTQRAVHPAGEGGEYESLVVDAPFFCQRLELDEQRTVTRGLASRLDIARAHLLPKPPGPRARARKN